MPSKPSCLVTCTRGGIPLLPLDGSITQNYGSARSRLPFELPTFAQSHGQQAHTEYHVGGVSLNVRKGNPGWRFGESKAGLREEENRKSDKGRKAVTVPEG